MDESQSSKIRINIDSYEKIETLYGIGPALAQRIVEFRQTNGYFQNPEELAKVEGMSLRLAVLLTPNIDWSLPTEQIEPKERQWGNALVFTILFILISWYILPELYIVPQSGIEIWIVVSGAVLYACIATIWGSHRIADLTRSRERERQFSRIAVGAGGIFIIAAISLGLANALYFDLFLPERWLYLFSEQTVSVIACFTVLLIAVFPQVLVLSRPERVHSAVLSKIYSVALAIAGPVLAYSAWASRNDNPLWLSIFFGIVGILLTRSGYSALRSGISLVSHYADLIDTRTLANQVAVIAGWQEWINRRLPNPEQQKKLKAALNKMHPPSPFKTISSSIILGAGAWLIVTALGAIVEWLIQKWLEYLF